MRLCTMYCFLSVLFIVFLMFSEESYFLVFVRLCLIKEEGWMQVRQLHFSFSFLFSQILCISAFIQKHGTDSHYNL